MSDAVVKDEWTPTLSGLKRATSPAAQARSLKRTAYKMVALLRASMWQQIGFADGVPYRPLKIKWRYHGHKTLLASKRNLKRAARGAKIRQEWFTRGNISKLGDVVDVVDKTRVTSSTKALIDLGDLRRSWDVTKEGKTLVEIGNKTSLEKLKAYYNDDRGRFSWGRVSENAAIDEWSRDIDRIFDGQASA